MSGWIFVAVLVGIALFIVSLYNQKEVWPRFGYEGSSAEHGGYINRGFADIDWLPKA